MRSIPLVLVLVAIFCGCASGAVTSAPPASIASLPAPTPTPDPHLPNPASVDAVYQALKKAGLIIDANSADAGKGAAGEPRKRLHLTYASWPLTMEQYSTNTALRNAANFQPGQPPLSGQAPFTFVGMNILVAFGARSVGLPAAPAQRYVEAATKLAAALSPLISPLRQSSVVQIAIPGTLPGLASPPAGSPSVSPAASP